MTEAVWIDPLGRRTAIARNDETYTHDGKPLPNGHYVFDRRKWIVVVYGPYPTLEGARNKFDNSR